MRGNLCFSPSFHPTMAVVTNERRCAKSLTGGLSSPGSTYITLGAAWWELARKGKGTQLFVLLLGGAVVGLSMGQWSGGDC